MSWEIEKSRSISLVTHRTKCYLTKICDDKIEPISKYYSLILDDIRNNSIEVYICKGMKACPIPNKHIINYMKKKHIEEFI